VIADTCDEIPDYSQYASPCNIQRVQPLDLVPLKRNHRRFQYVRSYTITRSADMPYHPSRWGPVYLQYIDDYPPLIMVGPPDAPPFVLVEREAIATRVDIQYILHWQTFGGKAPHSTWITYPEWVLWQLQKQVQRTKLWGDVLTPRGCLQWNPAPADIIKEHVLIGQDLFTVSVEHLDLMLPHYRHQLPATLDLVLCQVWHDMGRAYRVSRLNRYEKYLYLVYTKLPKTYARYKLTYHEDAPIYHS
jgi:hypothetical protein